MLRYFICEYLKACSIYMRSELYILEQAIDFWHFVNKPSWYREFHVQQGKHRPNSYLSLLLSHFTCVNLFTAFCGTANFKIFDVPNNFWNLLCLYVLKNFMFRKVRNHTPIQGNWLVAWSQSERMLHQGTYVRMNLWHNCEKQECRVFISWVICSPNMISANAGVSQKWRNSLFSLPFGCFLDRYLIPKVFLQICSKC